GLGVAMLGALDHQGHEPGGKGGELVPLQAFVVEDDPGGDQDAENDKGAGRCGEHAQRGERVREATWCHGEVTPPRWYRSALPPERNAASDILRGRWTRTASISAMRQRARPWAGRCGRPMRSRLTFRTIS